MKPSEEVPEQIDVSWDVGDWVGNAGSGTVEAALADAGVAPETLAQLHQQGFTLGTPAADVSDDAWRHILERMSPEVLANVAQLNRFFHELVREVNIPVGSATDPMMVHVYNAKQLTAATGMGGVERIAVHEGIDGAAVAAAAAATWKPLLLGPRVTVTGITGGYVHVYAGATVTGISGGKVSVYGGTVTGITGGAVYVRGGTVTGITGGLVFVFLGSSVQVPADIKLHQDPGNPNVSFNGADKASSTLIVILQGGTLIQD